MHNPFNPNGEIVRTADEIQKNLVNHARNAHRKDAVDLLCSWRRARERHMNSKGRESWREFQRKVGGETSQALRAVTLLSELEGSGAVYRRLTQGSMLTFMHWLHEQPDDKQITMRAIEENLIQKFIRVAPPTTEIMPVIYHGREKFCRIYERAASVAAQSVAAPELETIPTTHVCKQRYMI